MLTGFWFCEFSLTREKVSQKDNKTKIMAKLMDANMKKVHFNNELGLEIESFDETGSYPEASFIYRKKDTHINNYDAIHGGIIASVFDVAMGLSSVALTNRMVTTADISLSYLRPAMGDLFRIKVEIGHVGQNLVNCTAKLYSINGEEEILCATSLGNYFVLDIPLMIEE